VRTIIMLVAVMSTAALSAPMSRADTSCQTRSCNERAHAKNAKACKSKACLARACRSTTCRARVAEKHWRRLQAALPSDAKAMLARLRGCETRGISFPSNYRWKGHHRGAYQYTFGTWVRAGGRGDPADASPAEQDVRTARFYPAHRGEWACVA
jgi:hypothetical protein